MSDAVRAGWVRAPVGSQAGPDCRSESRPPQERPTSRPGIPVELPVAPDGDRVTGDSGPRGSAALPAQLSGPDRVVRHSRTELAPALAKGLPPTVAGRPG